MKDSGKEDLLTFGGHLEILRKMIFRIVAVTLALSIVVFCNRELTFRLLLAPREWNFITYRCIEKFVGWLGIDFHFVPYQVHLISTELSSQFVMHLSSSFYLALLCASPYILYELFRFVTPALYEREKRYSFGVAVAMYGLFVLGVLMNYYVIFPVSFRFLGTYQVDASIENTITLASYISTFSTLTFVLGLVFQLPVMAFVMAKLGWLTSSFMRRYRKHAFLGIMLVAAIITPPDLFTLVMVTVPLYLLYECGIGVVRGVERSTYV